MKSSDADRFWYFCHYSDTSRHLSTSDIKLLRTTNRFVPTPLRRFIVFARLQEEFQHAQSMKDNKLLRLTQAARHYIFCPGHKSGMNWTEKYLVPKKNFKFSRPKVWNVLEDKQSSNFIKMITISPKWHINYATTKRFSTSQTRYDLEIKLTSTLKKLLNTSHKH